MEVGDDPKRTENSDSGTRLDVKLGFSRSAFVPVPHIMHQGGGPDGDEDYPELCRLRLFAVKVRKSRPPEPYKVSPIYVLFIQHASVNSSETNGSESGQ